MLLLGTKLGMTRVLEPTGASIPVTVIECGPCIVTQVKTAEKDGYTAVQVAYGDMKARNSTQPLIGHDAKAGSGPKRHHREFHVKPEDAARYEVGKALTVKDLEGMMYVDVIGTSKGKGFQGTMKRHNFKGMCATHGTERKHRSPGSIGSYGSNRGFGGGLLKGKRMAGHMGDERVTTRSLDIVRIDPERNLLLVKGPVPGANRGMVMVRPAIRLYKSKAKKLAAAAEKK
ncbi:MAG: 50S ribosomal protein L3 [Phycisphaerales bacterium]